MINGRDNLEFHPELLPRRGELFAWICAVLAGLGWLTLALVAHKVTPLVPLLTVALFLAALVISLSNWADRSTIIRMDENGIGFRNGLRNVNLTWSDIREVRVYPSQWGKKVYVIGEKEGFSFRTLAEVRLRGDLKGRFGFAQGDDILRSIVLNSGLEIQDQLGGGYMYSRR
mgnify:CR=1 FL=1